MSRRKDAWGHDSVCASFPGWWTWGFVGVKRGPRNDPDKLAAKFERRQLREAGSVVRDKADNTSNSVRVESSEQSPRIPLKIPYYSFSIPPTQRTSSNNKLQ